MYTPTNTPTKNCIHALTHEMLALLSTYIKVNHKTTKSLIKINPFASMAAYAELWVVLFVSTNKDKLSNNCPSSAPHTGFFSIMNGRKGDTAQLALAFKESWQSSGMGRVFNPELISFKTSALIESGTEHPYQH